MVLILFLYVISPLTQKLRSIKVYNDQNIRWRLRFSFFTDKEQEFLVLSTYIIPDDGDPGG